MQKGIAPLSRFLVSVVTLCQSKDAHTSLKITGPLADVAGIQLECEKKILKPAMTSRV